MKTFDQILGQERAIDTIRAAYASDRLPHGLIFAGPAGIGKATTAAALAAVFLCEKSKDVRACGKCESCRAMSANMHPDYHVITKELVRFYDASGKSKAVGLAIKVILEELVAPAGRKSSMGRGKVFVVEQAELMTAAAQNSMLKTLEEPAGRTLIILLTDQPESMLSTIRSRCQTIRFASLDIGIVRGELEKRGIDRATAQAAAELADGSIGTAIKWIEDGVIAPASELASQMDALLAGRASGDLADWLKTAAEAFAEKQLERDELASKDASVRIGLAMYLALAAQRLRVRMKTSDDPALLDRALAAIDAMVRTEMYLDANVNIPVALQQLAVTLSDRKISARA